MRKATSGIVGLASAVAIGASWAAGLTPPKPAAAAGVHLLAAGPPTVSGVRNPLTPPAARATAKATTARPKPSSGGTAPKPPDLTTTARAPAPAPASAAAAAPAPAPAPAAAPAPVSGSVLGGAASTPYGVVQVKVSYSGTKITAVRAVRLTDSSQYSVSLSADAAPTLRQEALAAQSAQIDVVSGATYTSEGYIASLQSAIDAAHLG